MDSNTALGDDRESTTFDLVAVENAVIRAILVHGSLCISNANLRTGYRKSWVRMAIASLQDKRRIEVVPGSEERDRDYRSFQIR